MNFPDYNTKSPRMVVNCSEPEAYTLPLFTPL